AEVARPSSRAEACRATGVCSGHGPEQHEGRVTRRGQQGEAGAEVARPSSRAAAGGRSASGRGTATNRPRDARPGGVSEAKPAPKSPDQEQGSRATGVCSGHGPEQAEKRVTRRGQGRRSGPRSRPTINPTDDRLSREVR